MDQENRESNELESLSREGLIKRVRELEKLVFIDAVTGLPNRRAFERDLQLAISEAERYGEKASIILVDLDKFKPINDILGHQKGDEALRETGQKFVSSVRASDSVYRLGGDEFLILVRRTDEEGARTLGNKLQNQEYSFGGLPLGLSYGVAQYGTGCLSIESMIKVADGRMYANKQEHYLSLAK